MGNNKNAKLDPAKLDSAIAALNSNDFEVHPYSYLLSPAFAFAEWL